MPLIEFDSLAKKLKDASLIPKDAAPGFVLQDKRSAKQQV